MMVFAYSENVKQGWKTVGNFCKMSEHVIN